MKRSKPICLCLVVLIVIGVVVCSTAADNLLDDPGFELSQPDGSFPSSGYWDPAWLGTAGAVCTSTAARTGSVGLWQYTGVSGSDWWSGPYQEDMAAVAEETFNGSAWVRSQPSWVNGSRALIRVTFLDSGREASLKGEFGDYIPGQRLAAI